MSPRQRAVDSVGHVAERDTGNPADDLAAFLSDRLRHPVTVVFTRNRHRLISVTRGKSAHRVRVQEALADAPGAVHDALARFVAKGGAEDGLVLRAHVQAHMVVAAAHTPEIISPLRLRPVGRCHDLRDILATVVPHLPPADPLPAITWGPRRRPGLRRVRLGSYDPVRSVIRVNPVLDHPSVPTLVVAYVVHHELVHHLLRPEPGHSVPKKQFPTRPHGPQFIALEQRFPALIPAQEWQRNRLPKRLRTAHKTGI